jgi:DNA-binding MarR family transcriptional regulator
MSQIIRDIIEIARISVQYRGDQLAPMGLKSCHASYLTEICAKPGISQDGLARIICLNKSNVARQAAILEEDGFIIRKPSAADKRVVELYPTEKALALKDRIYQCYGQWSRYLTQDFTEEEQALLSRLMGKIAEKAQSYGKGADDKCAQSSDT